MKQLIIGLGVLGMFIMYSLWVRHEQPTLAKPSSLAAANTATTHSSSQPNTSSNAASQGTMSPYKDGTYTGSAADAYYGTVDVSVAIAGGEITDVTFLQYPDSHDTSVMINQQAMPYLKQEAIQAQSAHVQIVSGATFTSEAFIQSLSSALMQAKA